MWLVRSLAAPETIVGKPLHLIRDDRRRDAMRLATSARIAAKAAAPFPCRTKVTRDDGKRQPRLIVGAHVGMRSRRHQPRSQEDCQREGAHHGRDGASDKELDEGETARIHG